ncbi:hypothetical protein KA529_01245 [Candidatus Saccharibacteria bacterium]|jgi:hypothetical protein|nr:hypothetical protein [Candidatus Saccharibacteria bacterium]
MSFKQLSLSFNSSLDRPTGVVETNCFNDDDFIKNDDSPGVCDTLQPKYHYCVSLKEKIV